MREVTVKLIDLAESGTLRWEDIARECLEYMSEAEVRDMAEDYFHDYIDFDEDEDDGS